MPTERRVTTALAAGALSANLLADSKWLYLPGPHAVQVYAVADAAGVLLELSFGNTIDTQDFELPVRAATVGPFRSDDLAAAGVGVGGDLVSVRLRNSGAAATNIRTLIDLRPL